MFVFPAVQGDLRRFLVAACLGVAPVQKSMSCRAIADWLTATCLFAAPVAWARALPVALFAAVSHMLMYGFFFNHGLLMRTILRWGRA